MQAEVPGATGVDPTLPTRGTWGYSAARTADEFAASFERLLAVVVHTPLFSGFCYTQFCDTFQEANGLLFADRTPKIPLERIAKAARESRTYIPGGV
jgi:hypothetical protein